MSLKKIIVILIIVILLVFLINFIQNTIEKKKYKSITLSTISGVESYNSIFEGLKNTSGKYSADDISTVCKRILSQLSRDSEFKIPSIVVDDKIYICAEIGKDNYNNEINNFINSLKKDNYYTYQYGYGSEGYISYIVIKNYDNSNSDYDVINKEYLNEIYNRVSKAVKGKMSEGQLLYLKNLRPSDAKYRIKKNPILEIESKVLNEINEDCYYYAYTDTYNVKNIYKVKFEYDANGDVTEMIVTKSYSAAAITISLLLITLLITITCEVIFKHKN